MKSKILRYTGVKTTVSYDVKRCIHAAECVHGLPDVFNPDRKPWIEPDRAEPEQLLRVVTDCPTGALHLESTDGGQASSTPEQNTATIEPNGPIYLHADLEVVTQQGEILLEDTRLALCRCGASENKPLCDGRHAQVGFEDDGTIGAMFTDLIESGGGKVRFTTLPNGPVLFEGTLSVEGVGSKEVRVAKGAFCRCGASKNKPFCDGSHGRIGFTAD